jgi:hypothetical protein
MEETVKAARNWWYCCNCHQIVDKYCGENIIIGDKPETKGRSCALARPSAAEMERRRQVWGAPGGPGQEEG